MHWPVLIPIALIVFAALVVTRNEVTKRKLVCPHKGTTAELGVQRSSFWPTKRVRIRSCDQLPDPERVDCDQACLKS